MSSLSKYSDKAAPILLAGLLVSFGSAGCGEAEFTEGNGPGAASGGPKIQPGGACIGVDPNRVRSPESSDERSEQNPEPTPPQQCDPGTCVGEPAPEWKAYDYQPLSCGYGKEYGLQAFVGQPLLMVHLAGWCPYCQTQSEKLEKIRLELEFNKLKAHIIIVNSSSADNDFDRDHLTKRCSVPLFQDTTPRKVWDKNGGGKDDFYFYDHLGVLRGYFPHGGEFGTNLSLRADYQATRDRLFDLARAVPK